MHRHTAWGSYDSPYYVLRYRVEFIDGELSRSALGYSTSCHKPFKQCRVLSVFYGVGEVSTTASSERRVPTNSERVATSTDHNQIARRSGRGYGIRLTSIQHYNNCSSYTVIKFEHMYHHGLFIARKQSGRHTDDVLLKYIHCRAIFIYLLVQATSACSCSVLKNPRLHWQHDEALSLPLLEGQGRQLSTLLCELLKVLAGQPIGTHKMRPK